MNTLNEWQIPGSWVEIYEHIFVPAMVEEWPPQVVALTNLQQGETALDVACGTGALTRHVAKLVGPHGRVVGLDLSPDMLSIARATSLNRLAVGSIEWREGDVNTIPFASETFDAVFCTFALMVFPDRVAALKEMRRVLKPGGRMALSVWGDMKKCPGQTAIKESWEHYFGADEAAGFVRQHVLSDPKIVYSLIRDAGFDEVSVQPTIGTVRFPSPEYLVRSYGALIGKQTNEQTRASLIAEVSTALQLYNGPTGLIYPIEAILASARK